jgi:hypothetical protein
MTKGTNRTKNPDKSRDRLYDERHRLTPTTSVWAAVALPVLRLLQHEDVDRAIRVLFYLIEHSWAMMIPPANYQGDGTYRDDWRPSTFAVRPPQRPDKKARSPFWSLAYIRSKDIADDLGLDEGNVSKELKWLGDRGAIRTDPKGRPIFPIQVLDAPTGLTRKKLSETTTSDFQHPYFQQLFDFRFRIEAAYEEAKREALAPVVEAYRPAFEKVNTHEKELRKAAKKAKKQGVDLSKVVKVDNFEELTAIVSTEAPANSAPEPDSGEGREVVKVDNSKPLSPIRRVVKADNFSAPIKNLGRDTDLKTNNQREKSVGQSPEKATDRPTAHPELLQAIRDTGLCEQLADTPSETLLSDVARILNGTPLRLLQNGIRARWEKITGLGMLRNLATAAAGEHAANPAKRPARTATRDIGSIADEEARRGALDILNDPEASERDRQLARDVLQSLEQPA